MARSLVLLVVGLAALLNPATLSATQPAGQVKGLAAVRVIAFSPSPAMVVARERGYFAAEGLAVT
jgi:hypothetical protein